MLVLVSASGAEKSKVGIPPTFIHSQYTQNGATQPNYRITIIGQ